VGPNMSNCKSPVIAITAAAFLCTLVAPPVGAQFSYRRTVGDESENQYQPGGYLAIKYRGAIIGNPNLRQNSAIIGNFTRHTRLGDSNDIGGSSGIGGSSLQTESVTSESRSALLQPSSIAIGTPLISRPVLNLRFGAPIESPALKSFRVQLPTSEETDLFGRVPETFTNTSSMPTLGNSSFSRTLDEFQFGQ
jgi:hypothetical protein